VTSWLQTDQAARCIMTGGVIAYPTEAVYGIGCLPFDEDALDRIIALKRRDAGKGLIVVAATIEQLEPLAELPQGETGQALRASWPGPVTWIVPARPRLPGQLTGGRATIAVRISGHPIVRRLCRRTGSALVSTSANRSGRAPARTALAVRRALGRDLDLILAGPLGDAASPTEIRDAASGKILRRG
jgi:L-threonylcarbamoyladenylate synthase